MVKVTYDALFKKQFKKIKNKELQDKVRSQIRKVVRNPTIGKPMRYGRKDTRELYIKPLRLSYAYVDDTIIFLALYHKDEQ